MTMTVTEFRQLKKLLTLATSDNDAEALACWRKATQMVARHGFTWEMVMDRLVRVVQEVEADPEAAESEDSARLFDMALSGASGDFRSTILSIRDQLRTKGWLSDRQWQVVRDAADRAADKRPAGRVR